MDIIDKDVEGYAYERTRSEPELLRRLSDETYATMEWPTMLTGRLEGRLLKLLAALSGARRVLEIGTFTGYSALSMAEGLPDGGKVITCEIDPRNAVFAQRYLDASPHGRKVEIRIGPALETLAVLRSGGGDGGFDLAFIDADKSNYPAYYEQALELVRAGGLIVVDNTLWSGQVLHPEDEESRAIDTLNRRIAGDSRVENVLLTIRDGVQLVRKLP
jgi:caffeoyl-CoA O-methyltransferase